MRYIWTLNWVLAAGSLIVNALNPDPAFGCAGVYIKGGELRIAEESAIIVWDAKSKTQHFIRRASFQTKMPYFGFLVPTPTKPELAETLDEVFNVLEDCTKPKVVKKTEWRITALCLELSGSPSRSNFGSAACRDLRNSSGSGVGCNYFARGG